MEMVLLNVRSACECWERGFAHAAVPFQMDARVRLSASRGLLEHVGDALPLLSRPYEVLVADRSRRSSSELCRCRLWTRPIPAGALYRIGGTRILVAAPWFCFLQMATRMPLPQAVRLGMEMCGGHSTLPFSRAADSTYEPDEEELARGYVERPAICQPPGLVAGVASAVCAGGESRALAAARLVAGNSRSPAESRFFIRMFLPSARGGYGLPWPELNVERSLPPDIRALAGVGKYVCDFYYPHKRLAIEFDGGYHWNGAQRLDDNLRELVLNSLNVDVVRVDRHQLESLEAMDLSVREVARHLGFRVRKPSESICAKRLSLQSEMLDYSFDLYA